MGLLRQAAPLRLPWCGTFHSVAARLLRDEAPALGLASGFTVLDRPDSQDLLALQRQRLDLAETSGAARFPLPATCLAIHSRAVNAGTPLGELLHSHWPWCVPHEAALVRLFGAWQQAKRDQHSLDYDDLLLAWAQLMATPDTASRTAARWQHVLVDEVQDINRPQADILHALAAHGCTLTAVGDDAQSIYAFRGASVRHILDFPQRFSPPAAVLPLQRNYRSTPQLLAASNAVVAEAAERFDKRLWSARAAGTPPRIATVADEATQAQAVADAVLAARETGLLLKRQAVLFRAASHSAPLELELARRRVPFVKYGGLKFLEAAHVKDLLAVLRWADNPASQLAALRCARLVPGMGPASVARLLAQHAAEPQSFVPPAAAREAWAEFAALMARLRKQPAWPQELHRVVEWLSPQLERLHDDARVRLLDLQQLVQMATTHASRQRFVTELALEPPEASSDESGVPLVDEDYLILSTLHSAKGQEWNAVHLLNMSDGCMPADVATGSTSEIEEERRLLYVGMTRAKDELTLWVPQRFHVTQQRKWGAEHLYAIRTRFIGEHLLPHFEQVAPMVSMA